ncbi:MAG: hypothetical protein ABJF11_20270 [Reichenbachiella sp.]|uniref:hypothetical protein n=1 Tax=Reichenbachiella sp. TaxID=2184521 RepID=UPI0032669355
MNAKIEDITTKKPIFSFMENQSNPIKKLLVETALSMFRGSIAPTVVLVMYGFFAWILSDMMYAFFLESANRAFGQGDTAGMMIISVLFGMNLTVLIKFTKRLIKLNIEEIRYFKKMRKHQITLGW